MEELSCLLVMSLDGFPLFPWVVGGGCAGMQRKCTLPATANRDNDGRFSFKAPHGGNMTPPRHVRDFIG